MNALTGTRGASRKSPVEIFADAASVVTRSPYAEVTGLKHGKLGRWTDGVAELRSARTEFAAYWDAHNDQVLTKRERAMRDGADLDPLWVVLGDSTAQGLGAPGPRGGYVGQTLYQLRRTTGSHWQVLNLSVSGALMRDVLADQIRCLTASAPTSSPVARPRTTSCTARRASSSATCAPCSRRSRRTRSCSTCRCSPASGGSSAA